MEYLIALLLALGIALFVCVLVFFVTFLISSRRVFDTTWEFAEWQNDHPGVPNTHPEAQKLIEAKVAAIKWHLKLREFLRITGAETERLHEQEIRFSRKLVSQPA